MMHLAGIHFLSITVFLNDVFMYAGECKLSVVLEYEQEPYGFS
jgi:hypothetical protein